MATPALRLLRDAMPGAFLGGLCRPGIDRVLAGSGLLDELHVASSEGVMAPKRAAGKVRGRGYAAALLLTNSFSTALAVRMAFIPRRVGYDRDGRGVLLTQRLSAPRTTAGTWAIVPAVEYYHHAASAFLDPGVPVLTAAALDRPDRVALRLPPDTRLELGLTDEQRAAGERVRAALGLAGGPFAVLIPGGNNAAKRWPAEQFGRVARHLRERWAMSSVVCGSPAEKDVCAAVAAHSHGAAYRVPEGLGSLDALKALCAGAAIVVCNDTGPRHIAAAFGRPIVSLFGPTDPRWTTIPHGRERLILADPTLDVSESANDHPERCSIERIEFCRVVSAADELLGESPPTAPDQSP
jgi:heptosyltransferase-2